MNNKILTCLVMVGWYCFAACQNALADPSWKTDTMQARQMLADPAKLDQANALLMKAWSEVPADPRVVQYPAAAAPCYTGVLANFEELARQYDAQKRFDKSTTLWIWLIATDKKIHKVLPLPHLRIWLANSYIQQGQYAKAETELSGSEAALKPLNKSATDPMRKLAVNSTNLACPIISLDAKNRSVKVPRAFLLSIDDKSATKSEQHLADVPVAMLISHGRFVSFPQ